MVRSFRADEFGLFADRFEALVEELDYRVAADGGQGGHVEGAADTGAAAGDMAAAAHFADVAIDRGEADEGGNLAVDERAEFG